MCWPILPSMRTPFLTWDRIRKMVLIKFVKKFCSKENEREREKPKGSHLLRMQLFFFRCCWWCCYRCYKQLLFHRYEVLPHVQKNRQLWAHTSRNEMTQRMPLGSNGWHWNYCAIINRPASVKHSLLLWTSAPEFSGFPFPGRRFYGKSGAYAVITICRILYGFHSRHYPPDIVLGYTGEEFILVRENISRCTVPSRVGALCDKKEFTRFSRAPMVDLCFCWVSETM